MPPDEHPALGLFSQEEVEELADRASRLDCALESKYPEPVVEWVLRISGCTLMALKPVIEFTVIHCDVNGQVFSADKPASGIFQAKIDLPTRLESYVDEELNSRGLGLCFYYDQWKSSFPASNDLRLWANFNFASLDELERLFNHLSSFISASEMQLLERLGVTDSNSVFENLKLLVSAVLSHRDDGLVNLIHQEGNLLAGLLFGYPRAAIDDNFADGEALKPRSNTAIYSSTMVWNINYDGHSQPQVMHAFHRMEFANYLVEGVFASHNPNLVNGRFYN